MPDNLFLYLLLVVALGIGYAVGRIEKRRRVSGTGTQALPQEYFRGLNHLLNERPDLAIDTFIQAMAVNNDTVDTHLALGSLVRRRGEVDKAIRIHQNLLARPVLSNANRALAELELARDYYVAGLLGRAESLLKELIQKNGEHKQVALELLLEVYQRESDWPAAIEIGSLLSRQDKSVRIKLAHFRCEMAEQALRVGDLRGARWQVSSALSFDASCARANLIGAQVEFKAGRYRDVMRLLKKVREQDILLTTEGLNLYREAAVALGDESEFLTYVREAVKKKPLLGLVKVLGEHISVAQDQAAAREYVVEQLLHHPSLGAFVLLMELLEQADEPLQGQHLKLVLDLARELLKAQPRYRCNSCGFSGNMRMWQCPSCHQWGTLKPIQPIQLERPDFA
ncbi:MAG: lipopolysaccharide assembly protein LapB [Proteobacteria bacterium]|nr:lipopolysaccharide assembly protein LapB [Pseudomonadota bacterium]